MKVPTVEKPGAIVVKVVIVGVVNHLKTCPSFGVPFAEKVKIVPSFTEIGVVFKGAGGVAPISTLISARGLSHRPA